MARRLLVVAALAGAAIGAGAAPASAQCYPEKPQTCHHCTISGVHIGDDGVWLESECA